MDEKFREYLKDLSPELREKAKDIKTQEELTEFLSDNDIELPEDALEAVSGGCEADSTGEKNEIIKGACPDCGGDLLYHDNVIEVEPHGIFPSNQRRAHCAKTGELYIERREGFGRWEKYPKVDKG